MDATLEKTCLEEISHTVLDAQQKISVRSISNNYGLNFLDAVKVLQQWIDKNGAKANLLKEFIVRGIDAKRGGAFITVANEKKLKTIQDKANQVSSVLYAVEVQSESSRSLNIPEEQEFTVINLPLTSDKRDVKVFVPAEPSPASTSVKQESKPKINSMFAASASKPKPTPVAVKEEKPSPPAKQEAPKISPPQKSPTKGSPSKKKDVKKPVSGKASIASFFSNKPAASKPAPSTPVNSSKSVDVKKEKSSPKEQEAAKKDIVSNGKPHEDTPRWKRMISDESDGDDVVPNTPQETKEPKKRGGGKKPMAFKKATDAKGGNPSKRSRILQVEDSSEEEEDEDRNLREPEEEKTLKFNVEEEDEDVQMEEKKQLTPEKPVENDSNSLNRKGRAKVKKLVTRNFMDDEGYMTTIKEYVMVSASEDETEEETRTKSSSDEKKTGAKDSATSGKNKTETKAVEKKADKVTPPVTKTKQGSIMSFFSKK